MSNRRTNMRGEDVMAAADKEMEERANRAKELLSMRYTGLRHNQVSIVNKLHCRMRYLR